MFDCGTSLSRGLRDGSCDDVHDKRQDGRNPSEYDRRDPPAPSATRSNGHDALDERPNAETGAEKQLREDQKAGDRGLGIVRVCSCRESFSESGPRLHKVAERPASNCRNNRGHKEDNQAGDESRHSQSLRPRRSTGVILARISVRVGRLLRGSLRWRRPRWLLGGGREDRWEDRRRLRRRNTHS